MDWNLLTNEDELDKIVDNSATKTQVIFKHSTRCSISSVAKGRLDRASSIQNADFHYLDLINYRDISNKVAELFNVEHESPQVLVIREGKCIYHQSHMGINMQEILEVAI